MSYISSAVILYGRFRM
uniref:Uncharacterized protein n=1 Tax=Anguilla anguilla TaxID=7936 RepID=A0A0E9XLV4_ANGAN